MKMKAFYCVQSIFAAVCASAALCSAGCSVVQHVPPGQSVAFARARKAEIIALPPAEKAVSAQAPAPAQPEPSLPAGSAETEQVADSFTLGNFCMTQERYAEAIAAYETAVRINPNFADAWNKLAVAYQNTGQDKKALYAFRKSKSASMQ